MRKQAALPGAIVNTASIEAQPDRPTLLIRILVGSTLLSFAGAIALFAWKWDELSGAFARMGPLHRPDLAVLGHLSRLTLIHIALALSAILLGAFMMMSRKGKAFHRVAGWIWSALVMSIALSSLFMPSATTGGRWSPLHIGSLWVIVFLPMAVIYARRHRVASHRALMKLIFYGTLLVTFALTFLPGRFMAQIFFG